MTYRTKHSRSAHKAKSQAGLSLIELMIALGLGVFLLSGMLQTAASNRQAFELTHASSSIQDTARFSFDFVSETLRTAGYVNAGSINGEFADTMLSINNVNQYFQTFWTAEDGFEAGAVVRGTDNASDFFVGAKEDTDAISIRLQGDPDNPLTDCEGVVIAADPDPIVARTEAPTQISYYIDTDNNLVCDVAGARDSGAITLVNGIENLQIMYGVSADSFSTPTQYLKAEDMTAGLWNSVTTVSISILTRSETSPLDSGSNSETHTLLDTVLNTTQDGHSRQVFTYTITLRNRISFDDNA